VAYGAEVPHRSARSRYLLPLVLQVCFAGGFVVRDPGLSWWTVVLSSAIAVVLLAYAARNVVRLWRAPAQEAGWRTVTAYGLVGLLLTLAGSGPAIEGSGWESGLTGLVVLLFGVALLALAAREGRRTAARHRVPA